MKTWTRHVLWIVVAGVLGGTADAQSLPDSVLQRVRAGVDGIAVPGDSVSLPLVGTPTLPLVEARINGYGPFRLLIDLGSNVCLLRRDVVDSARCQVLVERSTTDVVRVARIDLGAARLEDVTVGSYDVLDVDGVLGYNALRHTSFTLDLSGQRLVLHHRSLPPPDGVSVLPYEVRERMPYVTVRIGADSLLVNLDTGAFDWMSVPPPQMDRLRWAVAPIAGRTVTNNQTGKTRILEGRLADTLRIGGLRIPRPIVHVNPEVEDAWLGAAAVGKGIWTFDPRHQRVRIEPRGDLDAGRPGDGS